MEGGHQTDKSAGLPRDSQTRLVVFLPTSSIAARER